MDNEPEISSTSGHLNVEERAATANSQEIACCCGKECKGMKGLKMHQRSCRTLHGLNDNLNAKLQEDILEHAKESDVLSVDGQSNDILENENVTNTEDIVVLKRGVKLPKSAIEWTLADEYFKAVLSNQPIRNEELDSNIEQLNDVIFEYCRRTHGEVDRGDDVNISNKHKLHTVKDLKREWKLLKQHNGNINEIKFVSRRLRNLLSISSRSEHTVNTNMDHDKYIRNNFWGYVKSFLTRKSTVLPTFNNDDCLTFFTKSFSTTSPRQRFAIPSWIPSLSSPHVPFNIDPQSYQQITNIIRNMKASASPCPLDQVSIISFKRCPYLRSYLTDLRRCACFSGVVPSAWKRACTVIVHKKGATDDPSNFRPITLKSVPFKIFTSCLRNSIFKFLTEQLYRNFHSKRILS